MSERSRPFIRVGKPPDSVKCAWVENEHLRERGSCRWENVQLRPNQMLWIAILDINNWMEFSEEILRQVRVYWGVSCREDYAGTGFYSYDVFVESRLDYEVLVRLFVSARIEEVGVGSERRLMENMTASIRNSLLQQVLQEQENRAATRTAMQILENMRQTRNQEEDFLGHNTKVEEPPEEKDKGSRVPRRADIIKRQQKRRNGEGDVET